MKMWKTKKARALLLSEALKMRKKEARMVSKKQTQSAKKDFQDKRDFKEKMDKDEKDFKDKKDSEKWENRRLNKHLRYGCKAAATRCCK